MWEDNWFLSHTKASYLGISRRKMRLCRLLLTLTVLFAFLQEANGLGWLSLMGMSSTSQVNPNLCKSLNGLSKRQVKLCRKNVEHMISVKVGAQMALWECQYQFRKRRWNCSMVDNSTVFGNTLKEGTREAAFVHALTAAGVSHKVTRDCSDGLLAKCGCDSSFRGDSGMGFQWSGCSDNVHYGSAFSRSFVDAYDRRRKDRPVERMLMNLHNNEAGRKVVEKHMELQCKCHGVSGSCELKTCWRQMPSFRKVGNLIKEKFDGATEVKLAQRPGKASRKQLVPLHSYLKSPESEDLVYLAPSPNYCDRNETLGTLGTRERVCNASSKGIDGCELLCCHRGFETRSEIRTERCHCKFHWCCYVKCKECQRRIEVSTCN